MFKLYDEVLIKSNNIRGIIVDIMSLNGEKVFTVESDEEYPNKSGYGKRFPLFDCKQDELKKV